MRSSKKRSSKSTLPIRPIRQSSSTGVLTDTLDRIEIVDNSKKNRKAYEEDLSEMMRLSSTRRFKWESTLQFFVAGVSYLIGYDSSFAFIQTFDKAGIAMIIPFLVVLVCYAVPVLYLEMALGQYSSLDPSMLFRRLCPAMSAIGYMSWAVALVGMVSNQAVIMVCLDLLMSSVSTVWNGEIHFAHCHHYYNTEDCIDPRVITTCDNATEIYYNGGCLQREVLHPEQIKYVERMLNRTFLDRQKTPAFQYFSGGLIGYTNGSILTNANLHVLTLALIAWLMMAVIAKGGIRVVCKVSYANVVAVIFLLGLLISSGLMETDGVEGFSHFLTFRGDKLLELEVWTQTFIYVSTCMKLGQGGLITMSSYNDFHENIFWCMLVLLSSMCVCPILVSVCLTPLYSALTVSLSLGQKFANENYREMLYHFIDLDGVVTTASALSMVPKISGGLLTLFSIAVMLLSLGNLMMRMILMVNSMREHFPLLQEKFYLHVAINAICVVGCLLNIGYYVRFGPRVYYAIVTVFLPMLCASVAMYESLTIAYCYGSKKMLTNIQAMLFGKESEDGIVVKTRRTGLWRLLPYFNGYMMICWGYLTPGFIIVFILATIGAAVRKMVENSHFTNKNTFMVFIVLVVFAILVIPAYCLIRVVNAKLQGKSVAMLFRPNLMLWGPRQKKHRVLAQRQEEKWRV